MAKLTIDLNNLTEDEREQLLALQKKAAIKKFELWRPMAQEKYCAVSEAGVVGRRLNHMDFASNVAESGNCYKKEKQAKEAAKMRVMRERLNQLCRYENERTGFAASFSAVNQKKFEIIYDHDEEKYAFVTSYMVESFSVAYVNKESAKRICNMLNNGEFSLLPEGWGGDRR